MLSKITTVSGENSGDLGKKPTWMRKLEPPNSNAHTNTNRFDTLAPVEGYDRFV